MLVINGLRDTNLRLELMGKHGLDWQELKNIIRAESVARIL